MNVVQKVEEKELARVKGEKEVPQFGPGDTVKVNVKVREGSRERIQAYEGVCIARKGSGLNENFTVRKISLGEGVERVFPLWSSRVDSIELVRRGSVRRAKLYYLRDRRGKSARIAERTEGYGIEKKEVSTVTKTEKRKAKKAEKQQRAQEAREQAEKLAKQKAAEEAAKAKEAEDAAKAAEAAANAAAAAEEPKAEGQE